MKMINRGDKQYTDIDNFKKYELTHCIAYEMAIRNDNIIRLIKDFLDAYALLNTPTYKEAFDFIENYKHRNLFTDFFINPYALYLEYHFFKDAEKTINSIPNFKNSELNIFFNPHANYYHKDKLELYREYEKENYHFKETLTNDLFHYDLATSLDDTLENRITPNYSRPLSVCKSWSREKDIYLNLALPTNELKDFIERLKRNKGFKSPSKSIYDFFDIEDEINTSILPNIHHRYADMLYAYDCRKLGFSDARIQSKIDSYDEDNDPNSDTISLNTIKKYIEIATESIDNQKYRQLVI